MVATSTTCNTLYIVCIEPIPTRYTLHWYNFLPSQITKNTQYRVVQVDGIRLKNETDSGAFFNFSSTIHYKDIQNAKIAKLFSEGRINDGDVFLFTDAWNPTCHNVRYMADLNNVKIKMVGIWHAGQYDPNDFLGRKFKDAIWAKHLEESMYLCYDVNVFATNYHAELFHSKRKVDIEKTKVCGFPMEYYNDVGIKFTEQKEPIVLFPHRISEEKNIDLFRELAKSLPQYYFIVAQEECSNKEQYHRLLEKSKLVFSANKQETLGIAMYEALLAGCDVMVPDHLSYSEMYYSQFKYAPSAITNHNIDFFKNMIKSKMEEPSDFEAINNNRCFLKNTYFDGKAFYRLL